MNENHIFSLEEREEARLRLIKILFEKSNGDTSLPFNGIELCVEAGINEALQRQTIRFLANEDLIRILTFGGLISISHEGIKEIEKSLKKPTEPTSYFPPLNIIINQNTINVDKMTNSLMQQGTNDSHQTLVVNSLTEDKLPQVVKWIEELKSEVGNLKTTNDNKTSIEDAIEIVEAILSTKRPKLSIIDKSLNEIKSLLAGITGSVLVETLIKGLSSII